MMINILALFIAAITLLFTILYASKTLQQLWFSWFYTIMLTSLVKRGTDGIRKKLFEKLAHIKPEISDKLVILEIGPARGNNFEFYPPNCRVIALDYNNYFEKYFTENKSNFPNVLCEDFINGNAEDMKQIADNSVDAVVATYILCSVNNREKALNEFKRVLKKGGVYFFMEHGGYPATSFKNIILLGIQFILLPLYYPLSGCCRLHRHSWHHIERAGFDSLELNYEYPEEAEILHRANIWGTATTSKLVI